MQMELQPQQTARMRIEQAAKQARDALRWIIPTLVLVVGVTLLCMGIWTTAVHDWREGVGAISWALVILVFWMIGEAARVVLGRAEAEVEDDDF